MLFTRGTILILGNCKYVWVLIFSGSIGLNGFQSCSFFLVAHKILVFHTKKSYSKSFCSKALNLINKCQDAISLFDHFLYLSNMLLNIATVDGKVLCSLLSSHESILSVVLWENHMWSLFFCCTQSLKFVLKVVFLLLL